MKTKKIDKLRREGSFTLIETVIALMIVTFLVIEVAAVQGNAIVFSDYGRNVTQATWLARRVMSQVDYYWRTKPFKELQTKLQDQKFEDVEDYTYSLEIKEWKFPFVAMLQNALGGTKDDNKLGDDDKTGKKTGGKGSGGGGVGDMIDTIVKQVFGDEPIFLTAHVEVSWPEGAQRNSTSMEYLLTNHAKLDEAIIQMKPVWDKLTKPPPKPGDKPGNPNVPPGAPGTPGPGQPGAPDGSGGDGTDPNGQQPAPPQPPPAPGALDAGGADGGVAR